MFGSRKLLGAIVWAACAHTALAGTGSDLTGSFVHQGGSDRDAVVISITVEEGSDRQVLVFSDRRPPDAHGAAPDGDGEGPIDRNGVLHFAYEDSFSNKGTGTFRRTKKGYELSIHIDHVQDPRCLVFYGEHTLQREPLKKSAARPSD